MFFVLGYSRNLFGRRCNRMVARPAQSQPINDSGCRHERHGVAGSAPLHARWRLVAERRLISTAVEEFLRAYGPAVLAREVVPETEMNGCHFRAGEMAMLACPAANRDPAMFKHAFAGATGSDI